MKFFLLVLLFFLLIVGPVFNSIGPWADSIFIVSLAIITYTWLFHKFVLPKIIFIFLILFLVPILVTLNAILYNIDYSSYELFKEFMSPFRIIINFLGCYCIVYYVYIKNGSNSFELIVELIYLAILINACIMAAQFFYPDFKDWIYSYTTNMVFRGSFVYNFRMGGLSGTSGGAVLSVIQSIGIIILPFLNKDTLKDTLRKKQLVYISAIVIVFSILVCGRSGIWAILFFLPLSIYLKNRKNGLKVILKLVSIVILALGSFYVLIQLLEYTKYFYDNSIFTSISRSMDTFLSFYQTNEFNDRTMLTLGSMISFPNEISTMVWGNAEHVFRGGMTRLLDSDIGYIRYLWGYGILGSILMLLPVYYTLQFSFKGIKKNEVESIFLLIIGLIMIIFHFKENFMYTRMLWSIYSIAFSLLYLKRIILFKRN